MRIRTLVLGGAVVLLALLGGAGIAAAQEDEISHESEECIEVLEHGGSPEDCHEAPSLILPETNEIVWGSISFAVLVFAIYRFGWPAMKRGMEGRTERIRADLEDAERAKTEAQAVLAEYQRQLADARNESARIIEEARQQADTMRRDLQRRAEAEVAELRQRAAADVESAKQQALADLRGEVVDIALGAAQTVVRRSLDRETSVHLIEDYINTVGTRS